jgi:hypothetical protein
MTKSLELAEPFTFAGNQLQTVDMTSIYRLSQENKAGVCLTLKTLSPNPVSRLVLAARPANLQPWKKAMPLLRFTLAAPKAQAAKTTTVKLSAQEKPRNYSMGKVTGRVSPQIGTSDIHSAGRVQVELPPGMPRYISATVLKRILGATPSELLLKKSPGDRWDICPDSLQIDLADPSERFRLGDVQVYS